jgi:hypothetical protein
MKREMATVTIEDSIPAKATNGVPSVAVRGGSRQNYSDLSRISGIVIGTLTAVKGSDRPLVDYPGNPQGSALVARSTATVREEQIGDEVALLFEDGDPLRPLLIGFIQQHPAMREPKGKTVTAQVDGERVVLTAEQELVLQCGEASITLTRAGKILIHGKYVLSRSSGMNRLRGASVEIN